MPRVVAAVCARVLVETGPAQLVGHLAGIEATRLPEIRAIK